MSIEQNIENLEIRNANVVTFVGTSSTMVDTISGRIQCKGFQHNSNVITDISGPHGRVAPTLKKYPEIIFEEGKFDKDEGDTSSNTYIQAGYVVRASSQVPTSDGEFDERQVWRLFDGLRANGTDHEGWMSRASSYETTGLPAAASPTRFTGDQGQWVEISLPHKIKLQRFSIAPGNNNNSLGNAQARFPKVIAIHGYDGLSWTRLQEFTTTQVQSLNETQTFEITTPTGYHEKFVLVVKQTWTADVSTNSSLTHFDEWKLYGYEEDPPAGDHSVDTTFKSRFNNPQLTGVQVFVDGKGSGSNQIAGGPVVTDTVESYDETGKYWNLTGELTSNISVEANTFLEGDQPHAVSVWFNSSNLEANVSNTCVFSIASEEKLDSVNLDLQSNTWHNLTYAYQGEGGSRVTYLDGRKVSEDQAEDTFGDYPPFAMTGYSQGGYVVSASSEATGAHAAPAYRAFDNNTSPDDPYRWVCLAGTGLYNSSGIYTGTESHTDVDGNVEEGEWLKLELPHKLKVSYFEIAPYPVNGSQSWRNYAILGSNDDSTWYQVQKVSGLSNANGLTAGSVVPTGTYKNSAFKYFVFIWSNNSGAHDHVAMGELKLYGHRENDLVRLPDPTNVLKYPHIEFPIGSNSNDPLSVRGYVVSGSSSSNSGIGRRPWSAFNDLGEGMANLGGLWQNLEDGANHKYTPQTTGLATTNAALFEGVRGEWIKLELPHKLKVSRVYILTSGGHEGVEKAILYGSNDDTNWDVIKDSGTAGTGFTFTLTANGGLKEATESVTTSNYYKYLLLQVTEVVVGSGSGDGRSLQLYKLRYFGTGVDSIPIQIGGGNIDKVANFRVYDKFIGEDQALEIWNAQKDEFGRAKPQMVLQQGKLGIGTNAPQGSLSVADEPHNLEEFPPRAMTGYKNYFEGHGEFCASASTWYNQASSGSPIYPWNAFNKGALGFSTGNGHANNWEASSTDYSSSTGLYTGSINTAGINGDWVQLELPYTIKLDYMELMPMYYNDGTHSNIGPARSPQDGHIMASNDGVNWISIYNWTGRTDFANLEYTRFKVPGTVTKVYKYFRIVWTRTNYTAPDGGNYSAYAAGGEIKFFGTREQGQSVLHDGQLTLTKSLTVPRIGPALDADDTPRRDRLVVEYNTSTNPMFEGVVRDTSGRGNDGVFYGGASYDATEKALVFDGSDDYIEGPVHNSAGEWLHSVSMWFKRNASDSYDVLFHLGKQSAGKASSMRLFSDNRFRFNFYDGDIEASYTVINGTWYHLAFSYSGGTDIANRKIYLNGVELTVTNTSGTPVDLNLDANEMFTLATQRAIIEGQMNCDISNFKLYDTVLTAQEVKTLYDMGRCDEGHHVVNFSKTRVGIGLGDGEAPRGALDVHDTGILSKGYIGNPYNGGTANRTGDLVIKQSGDVNDFSKSSGIRMYRAANDTNSWHFGVNDGTNFQFSYNNSSMGYLGRTDVSVIDFTGQHRSFLDGVSYTEYDNLEGLIVSANKNKYYDIDENITAGINAIQISQSLPLVSLSTEEKDKACFGVISGSEDPESREYTQGSFVSVVQKQKGDTRVYINSVGEGAIWVVNTNGSLESGDYITTSNVAGYGQKQDSEFLANYTVAKITMDCDFNPATQPVQQILRSNVVETYYLGNVHKVKSVPYEIITTEEGESNVVYDTKYTLTTTANVTESDPWDNVFIDPPEVTYATYSNLEANVQSTYTLTFTQTTTDEKTPTEWSALESNVQSLYNKVYYQSVEEEVAADYPGAVAHTRVTDQIENTLDEYGQIQWEDHPTETEKAYKVRYLTADGTQTDEANAVHIAAFVGCTYHCG